MVSWFSVAGVSSSRRAATISARLSRVPLLPTASLGSNVSTSATTGASTSAMRSRSARRSDFEIGSECTSSAVSRATPSGTLVAHIRLLASPTMTSRLPPPRSKHTAGAGSSTTDGADRAEDQARLLEAADDVDVHAGLRPDAVDELAAVRGAADRARGLGQDLGGARGLGEEAEAAHGGDGLVGRGGRDVPVAAHDVAEAEHLLLLHQRVDVPVGVDVGDEQVEGVRPEVHGCDAHERCRVSGRYGRDRDRTAVTSMSRQHRLRRRFRAMGTDVDRARARRPAPTCRRSLRRATAIERLEAKWSRFRPTSELCRAQRRRAARRSWCRPRRSRSSTRAVERGAHTGGRYDPTVLPAVEAAGYDRDFDAVARRARRRRRRAGARPRVRGRRARPARARDRGCPPASRSTSAASARATPPTSSARSCVDAAARAACS